MKYSVNVHFDQVFSVEVEAENEDAARTKAEDIAREMPPSECISCDLTESCVTDVQK